MVVVVHRAKQLTVGAALLSAALLARPVGRRFAAWRDRHLAHVRALDEFVATAD